MNPDLSHLRVTVVDLMGVFLPGVIWTILIATLRESFTPGASGVTPISVARELLAPQKGSVSLYIASSVLVLIVGYVAKTIAIPPSERLTRLLDAPLSRLILRFSKDSEGESEAPDETSWSRDLKSGFEHLNSADYRFPYHALHSRPKNRYYYGKIIGLVEARLGLKWNRIPRSQVFASCKRMLKLHAARLWEEAEYREAEVRMLASLFMASLFSLVLVVLHYFSAGVFNSSWAYASLAATLLLCFAFRARRRREVESIYFSFLSALPIISIATEEVEDAKGVTREHEERKGRSRTTHGLKRTNTALSRGPAA